MKKKVSRYQLRQYQFYLIPGLIFVFVIVSSFILVRPQVDQIFKAQENLRSGQEKLSKLTSKSATLESLDMVELQEKADLSVKALPPEINVPLVMTVFKALAHQNDLVIDGLSVQPGELATESANPKDKDYLVLFFSVSAKGELANLKDFLSKLSRVLPLFKVTSLDACVKGSENTLTLALPFDSPYLAPLEEIERIDRPLKLVNDQELALYEEFLEYDTSFYDLEKIQAPTGKDDPFFFNTNLSLENP
ncbi:hypothetical protein ACFL0Y_01740 [Patescibacteria group bacterium]